MLRAARPTVSAGAIWPAGAFPGCGAPIVFLADRRLVPRPSAIASTCLDLDPRFVPWPVARARRGPLLARRAFWGPQRPPRDRGALQISTHHSRQTLFSFCFLFRPLWAWAEKQRKARFAGNGKDVSESWGISGHILDFPDVAWHKVLHKLAAFRTPTRHEQNNLFQFAQRALGTPPKPVPESAPFRRMAPSETSEFAHRPKLEHARYMQT